MGRRHLEVEKDGEFSANFPSPGEDQSLPVAPSWPPKEVGEEDVEAKSPMIFSNAPGSQVRRRCKFVRPIKKRGQIDYFVKFLEGEAGGDGNDARQQTLKHNIIKGKNH